MPYIRSLARKDFIVQTNDLLQHAKYTNVTGISSVNASVEQMVMQAAIFKTSASIEEYLNTSITDWLNLADCAANNSSSLPDNVRWTIISKTHLQSYKNFIYQPNEKKLFASLGAAYCNTLLIDSNPLGGKIITNIVTGDRKYPSVKNVKSLYFRIGISDIFQKANQVTRKNIDNILKSFLSIREAIAHQSPPNITYTDTKRHLKNMQSFIGGLDRVLHSHVIKHHGSACWRS